MMGTERADPRVDPRSAAGIIPHYERHARPWDADRRALPWTERPWHERFASGLPGGAEVLDLGCGGGDPVARHLAACGLRITGVDASPTLIALCRERLPEGVWIVADMRALALGRRFGGVLAWDSFFHLSFDDQRAMFAVFAAHTAPGGLLMFNTGAAHGVGMGRYRGDPLYHASLDPADYRTLLADAGFSVIAHAVEDRRAGGRTVWLARSLRPSAGCPAG